MANTQKGALSLGDYLSIAYALSRGVLSACWAVSLGWARDASYPSQYKRHVLYAAARTVIPLIPVRIGQGESTVERYEAWAKKRGAEPVVKEVASGTRACWFGNPAAKKVLLWLHGGGYVYAASPPHVDLCQNLVDHAAKHGKELCIVMLAYDVAPGAPYPHQLGQAVQALQYLVAQGADPANIIVAGDSAGGNLLCGLLLHLTHPHPSPTVSPLTLASPLAGALLLSPWVTFDQTGPSFTSNLNKDALVPVALKEWSDAFMGTAPRDSYNHPLDADESWWAGLQAEKAAVVVGAEELFAGDVEALVEKMRVRNPQLEFFNAPGECHDAVVLDRALGLTDVIASEEWIKRWLLERL